MLHVTHVRHPLVIGAGVVVGHQAVLHGCTIEDGALIGIGARVLDGAVVERGAQVGAGAVVAPGHRIPAGHLALGIPARVARPLTRRGDRGGSRRPCDRYAALKEQYRATLGSGTERLGSRRSWQRERSMKRRGAGTITIEDVGSRVRLQAWVQRRRDLGGLLFLDLRDRSGVVQVVVRPDEHPEVGAGPRRRCAPSGWSRSRGPCCAASPGRSTATCRPARSRSIAERAAVLSRSEPPPFPLDGKIDAAEETRLRYRYLDLRRPELQKNFVLRAPGDARRSATTSTSRASSTSRRRSSPSRRPRARATTWCPRASTTAASTPCRSRRSSSSSS